MARELRRLARQAREPEGRGRARDRGLAGRIELRPEAAARRAPAAAAGAAAARAVLSRGRRQPREPGLVHRPGRPHPLPRARALRGGARLAQVRLSVSRAPAPGGARNGILRWHAPGDWNAFFGLALDNLTQLVILSSLLIGVFEFPSDLVLRVMVPGTAAGVLVGDLIYSWLAIRLMRRSGRQDVTAMPFGIDTPSLFGLVFGVLGPVMTLTRNPLLAWKIGMGVLKLGLAFVGDRARRLVPRAALLGSIAGVATLLIAFLPALKVFGDPLVGIVALTVVLVTLMGGVRMPRGVPGVFAAVLLGSAIFWGRGLLAAVWGSGAPQPAMSVALPGLALPWPT